MNKYKVSPDTVARTVCLLLALVNQILAVTGKEELPFADNQVYQLVSLIVTAVTAVGAWWKNNSFTREAIEADRVMRALKEAKHDQSQID